MRTITDDEDVGCGEISISSPIDLEATDLHAGREERSPTPQEDNITTAMDGSRRKIEINYRPDQAPPLAGIVNALDDGQYTPPANDNKPSRYHLREMAQRGELGTNEAENRRHWFDAQRLKLDLAISTGDLLNESASADWRELCLENMGEEPESLETSDEGLVFSDDGDFQDSSVPGECRIVDNAEGEPDQSRFLHRRQLISLAEDVLGHDFKVLKSVIVDNWTARMVGEDELFMDRATASACGKGMIRSALRNLSRFYFNLDRLELSGQRPLDAWPLIGKPASTRPAVPNAGSLIQQSSRHTRYLNLAGGPVIGIPERAAA